MSSANIELIKSIYDAFARRDMAGFLSHLSPEVTAWQSPELPWGGTYQGREGVQAFLGKVGERLRPSLTPERFIDSGEHVVVFGWSRGEVKANEAKFEAPVVHVWEIRGGQVVSLRFHNDNPTMLAALNA